MNQNPADKPSHNEASASLSVAPGSAGPNGRCNSCDYFEPDRNYCQLFVKTVTPDHGAQCTGYEWALMNREELESKHGEKPNKPDQQRRTGDSK